ncbi:MAG: hypothetical protein JWR19_1175 [Pedosphaera sp.]|nr:hypothetical protein [Pedosphaera sp.]
MIPTAFHSPRVNFIQSDTGFSIELLGRIGMEYREGSKVMYIESEILMTEEPTVAIWKETLRAWKPPHEAEKVTEEKRMEILKNISAALKWRDAKVKLHSEAAGWVEGWIE